MPRHPATSPGAPGTPPQRDVTTAPQTDASNWIAPLHKGVGGLHIEGAGRDNPFDSSDTTVANLLTVRKAREAGVRQLPGFWVSPDGVPHTQDLHFGGTDVAGDVKGFLVVRKTTITKIALSGTGTFDIMIGGSSVGTATNSGAYTEHSIDPVEVTAGTVVDGAVSSLTGTLYATLMEELV